MNDTVIYFAYDADGNCLYVGTTCNIGHRMWLHRRDSEWWAHHARIEVVGPFTRSEARSREQEEIARLSPPFNTTGVREYDAELAAKYRQPAPDLAEAMRRAVGRLHRST